MIGPEHREQRGHREFWPILIHAPSEASYLPPQKITFSAKLFGNGSNWRDLGCRERDGFLSFADLFKSAGHQVAGNLNGAVERLVEFHD